MWWKTSFDIEASKISPVVPLPYWALLSCFLKDLGNRAMDRSVIVLLSFFVIMLAAEISFQCGLSIMKGVPSKDFSVKEHDYGETSKIRPWPATYAYLCLLGPYKYLASISMFWALLV